MYLEDGTGSGYRASVTREHFLQVLAHSFAFEHYINHVKRNAYSVVVEQTPTGPNSCFLYMKNDSENDLIISEITSYADATEVIEVYLNQTGTPVGDSYIPTNRTSGSANNADVTCVVGNDVTGLSGGSLVERIVVIGTTIGSLKYDWLSDLIIPKNTTASFYVVNGGNILNTTLSIYFHNLLTHG